MLTIKVKKQYEFNERKPTNINLKVILTLVALTVQIMFNFCLKVKNNFEL